MKGILLGFVLILFDPELRVGQTFFDPLADFLGYFLLMRGLTGLAAGEAHFARARSDAFGMLVYTGVGFVLGLFGLAQKYEAVATLFSTLEVLVSLYIAYLALRGFQELERQRRSSLDTLNLMTAWRLLGLCTAAACVLWALSLPALLYLAVSAAGTVVYSCALWRTLKLCEN